MENNQIIDVVIVGGGQAGISLSYYLHQLQIEHIILEKDRAFSAWHNRWEGFSANTPNWMNTLPMLAKDDYPSGIRKGFATRDELVEYFERCLQAVDPPIKTNTEVTKVQQGKDGLWCVYTENCIYQTRNVAICNGAMSTPHIPKSAKQIPDSVQQLHSCEYKNPEQITTKSILIVGSGSSGVQICRLLCQSKRFEHIHLSVSKVMVLPTHVFGIQIHKFLHFFGLFDIRNNSLLGKLMYSNLETKGDPIMRPAPKDLSALFDVHLYGKFATSDGALLQFDDGQTLDTRDLSILWCTGFRGDYSFIEPQDRNDAFDHTGYPKHNRGVIDSAHGLYFVGLRYQHTVASHDIYGVGNDAKYVAEHIQRQLTY